MATHRKSIIGWTALPDTRLTTGNVIPEPTSINLNVNDRYRRLCWRFLNTSTEDALAGSFRVPPNYVGTAAIIATIATPTTTGNTMWSIRYTAVANGESADPSADQETATSAATAVPGTARLTQEISISLTSANFAVGDLVEFIFSRRGDSSDTLADNAYLLELEFQYSDV